MKCGIQVTTETRERLKKYGHKGESYNALINRLLDEVEKVRREKQMRF